MSCVISLSLIPSLYVHLHDALRHSRVLRVCPNGQYPRCCCGARDLQLLLHPLLLLHEPLVATLCAPKWFSFPFLFIVVLLSSYAFGIVGYLVLFKVLLNPRLLNSHFYSLLFRVCSSFLTLVLLCPLCCMQRSASLVFLGTGAQRSTLARASHSLQFCVTHSTVHRTPPPVWSQHGRMAVRLW